MIYKLIFSLIILSCFNILLASSDCIKKGETVGVYPGAPRCCKGLEAKSPPRVYGTAVCVEVQSCKKKGETVVIYPRAPKCCEGLEAKSSPGVYGSAVCIEKESCKQEGESVVVYPGAPRCCEGLEAISPPEAFGSALCVKVKTPSLNNINDNKRDKKPSIDLSKPIDSSLNNAVSK